MSQARKELVKMLTHFLLGWIGSFARRQSQEHLAQPVHIVGAKIGYFRGREVSHNHALDANPIIPDQTKQRNLAAEPSEDFHFRFLHAQNSKRPHDMSRGIFNYFWLDILAQLVH